MGITTVEQICFKHQTSQMPNLLHKIYYYNLFSLVCSLDHWTSWKWIELNQLSLTPESTVEIDIMFSSWKDQHLNWALRNWTFIHYLLRLKMSFSNIFGQNNKMIINILLFASNVLKVEIKCSKKPTNPSY